MSSSGFIDSFNSLESNKLLFSIITCNNILTLSISKYTLNTSVENNLYNLLIQNNIKVKVYGSENYDNKK